MTEPGCIGEGRPIDGVIEHYVGAFNRLFNRELTPAQHVRRLEAYASNGARTVGWSFVLNPDKPRVQGGVEVLKDYDDTQVATSQHKRNFHEACAKLLPLTKQQEEPFNKALRFINKVARISSESDSRHEMERYTPILALRGISRLLYNVANDPSYEIPQTEEKVRELVFQEVVVDEPKEWPTLPIRRVNERFVEPNEYSLGLQYHQDPPAGVYQAVWDTFREHVASGEIEKNELNNFDTPEDVWLTWFTFGPPEHQLENVSKTVKHLKDAGKRTPDEIIVVTEGFKPPLVDQRMEEFPDTYFIFVDDSVDQLAPLLGRNRLRLVHAKRPNTKYADVVAPKGVQTVLIANTPHSLIVADKNKCNFFASSFQLICHA